MAFKKIKVTINRKRWLRATDDGYLRNSSGKMCCLGFVGRACRIPTNVLLDQGTPVGVASALSKGHAFRRLIDESDYYPENKVLTVQLMDVNDFIPGEGKAKILPGSLRTNFTEAKREAFIKKGLGKLGFQVTFTN